LKNERGVLDDADKESNLLKVSEEEANSKQNIDIIKLNTHYKSDSIVVGDFIGKPRVVTMPPCTANHSRR
jgi:hypothetical protein